MGRDSLWELFCFNSTGPYICLPFHLVPRLLLEEWCEAEPDRQGCILVSPDTTAATGSLNRTVMCTSKPLGCRRENLTLIP